MSAQPEEETSDDAMAAAIGIVGELAESMMTMKRAYTEQTHAYLEVLAVAVRMAERLGMDDPDTQALSALMYMQQADQNDRLAEIRRLKEEKKGEVE